MSVEHVDIAVVGAGPAGSAAALAAVQRGFSVALIDRQRFPRDKPCGDGLGPRTANALRALGVEHVVGDARNTTKMIMEGPDGTRFNASIDLAPDGLTEGFVVPRTVFDGRLFASAVAAGALDYSRHKLVATEAVDDWRSVTIVHESLPRRLAARLVVGADGAYSATRRLLGVAPAPRHSMGIAMRAYCTTDAFDPGGPLDATMIFSATREVLPGYAWVFPTGRGTANVGVGITSIDQVRRRGIDLRASLDGFAASCRDRGVPLSPLRGHRAHQMPFGHRMPRLTHPRATLIGDAASMINPMSGEGIAYGMSAAIDLVDHLPGRLHDYLALQSALTRFERGFRRTHRRHFASGRLAAKASSNPWWTERVVSAMHADETVAVDVIDLFFGLGSIRPRTMWRIARPRRRRATGDAAAPPIPASPSAAADMERP